MSAIKKKPIPRKCVYFIIPALDEEKSIGKVLAEIPKKFQGGYHSKVLVVDNGSKDNTAKLAQKAGATVLTEPERGYGAACLKGMAGIEEDCFAVVFLDADYSDFPGEAEYLLAPIFLEKADLVIGSRTITKNSANVLLPQQRFGNWLAVFLIRLFWGFTYTDLGPFRAIKYDSLAALGMKDRNFGWTVEMQIKALQCGLRIQEVPVSYRKRIGKSKISGTVSGTFKAGIIILATIFKSSRKIKG